MPTQWYTSVVDGSPIFSVGINDISNNSIRHFVREIPQSPSVAICGTVLNGDGDDSNIYQTCNTCSLAVVNEGDIPV